MNQLKSRLLSVSEAKPVAIKLFDGPMTYSQEVETQTANRYVRQGSEFELKRFIPLIQACADLIELVEAELCPVTHSMAYMKCKCLRCARLTVLQAQIEKIEGRK